MTYGTFAPDEAGDRFPSAERVREDFRQMHSAGVNCVRTYTPPPNWLLEEARDAGLKLLIGIHWEGRDCCYDDPSFQARAEQAVRDAISRCKHYPDVVLAWCIGNEIPPLVIRFHGRRVVERFLERLATAARAEDPGGLVTYGSYPTTEFLQLDFLDFHTANVYLLDRDSLASYLDRLLLLAKGKPLLLGEVGDDSLRRGTGHQAELLDWTIPLALDKGCCGVCVFSWTDEWIVGDHSVEDWRFGLVDAERQAKPALEVVRKRFSEPPTDRLPEGGWPRISVVVCNYNGADTLDECLRSLIECDYPDFEIIYVDDGSTDDSLAIAGRFGGCIRIISQENMGLGVARNVGAGTASGKIVAYIDSDAYADPDWLRFLAIRFADGRFSAVGGPNLTPSTDGLDAQCIACCPGNPTYVLKDNVEADHIAGVNMAFRRDVLLDLGGFDPVHRKAGDDVDICWRLMDAGHRIGFAPASIVWHHRRPSLTRYLKQQYGYGEAENQLERKHPERFNLGGYIRWGGRIYMAPSRVNDLFRPFVYHGNLGNGMFQSLYQKDPSLLMFGPSMVHWYLACALLFLAAPLSPWLLIPAVGMLSLSIFVALIPGLTAQLPGRLSGGQRFRKIWIISFLHFVHPVVRWWGRLRPRLGDWRKWSRLFDLNGVPLRARAAELRHVLRSGKQKQGFWGLGAERREELVRELHRELKSRRTCVSYGSEWTNYDILVQGWMFTEGRLFSAGEQYEQALCWGLRVTTGSPTRILVAGSLLAFAWLGLDHPWYLAGLILPLLLIWHALGQRARIRRLAWDAVGAVMARKGGHRYERGIR